MHVEAESDEEEGGEEGGEGEGEGEGDEDWTRHAPHARHARHAPHAPHAPYLMLWMLEFRRSGELLGTEVGDGGWGPPLPAPRAPQAFAPSVTVGSRRPVGFLTVVTRRGPDWTGY